MKYIDKLNNEFVEEFASKYAKKYKIDIKGFEIKKFPQFFEVNYILNNGDKFPNHIRILINDFAAHSIEAFHDEVACRAWRVIMFKKFGDKYLVDLKDNINKELERKYKKKLTETDQLIKKIKDGKYDGFVK